MNKRIPKVLIISEYSFRKFSGGGILFSNLFEDFPKNRIALIHEDLNFKDDKIEHSICLKKNSNFKLFFSSFVSLKIKKIIKYFLKPFKTKLHNQELTKDLKQFIDKFKPEIIYTILGNNEMMILIKKIHKYTKIPLVIHIMDNWILARNSIKDDTNALVKYFIENSRVKIAINQEMSRIYSAKFSKKFQVIHNAISRKKIQTVKNFNKVLKILYVGSIYKDAQLNSIHTIARAIDGLSVNNYDFRFEIYLPQHQFQIYKNFFRKFKNVFLGLNSFNDDEYFSIISKSNLLILASNFDSTSISYYKYSWPAKMASYLMSGIPIFILGPEKIFFISQAKKKNWAFVCSENEESKIKESIYKILFSDKIKSTLIKNAIRESKKFEIEKMKKKFLNLLIQSIRKV